jgi:hypothetical protein
MTEKIKIWWDGNIAQYTPKQDGCDIAISQNIISTSNLISVDLITYPYVDLTVPSLSGITGNVQDQIDDKEPAILAGTSLQYWRGDKTWQTLDTSAVPENTNLYYLDSRSRLALSSSATGLTYTNTTGIFSLTTGYVIPTTTEESNWNSAYTAAVTNATALDTANTIVKRDASGWTAVSLSDDNLPTRISVNHNSRLLMDSQNHMSIDWDGKVQYGLDDKPIPGIRLQIDYQNSQLWSWYKYLISFHPMIWAWADFKSLDWKQCILYDVTGVESLNWDGHYANDYSAVVSIDWGGRYLLDHYGNASVDWENYILSDNDGFQIITFGNGSFKLNDGDGAPSIDYGAKQLQNGFGPVVDWSNGFKLFSASTGSGAALLGANAPTTYLSAPYTWVDIIAPDGTACVMPIWKK